MMLDTDAASIDKLERPEMLGPEIRWGSGMGIPWSSFLPTSML